MVEPSVNEILRRVLADAKVYRQFFLAHDGFEEPYPAQENFDLADAYLAQVNKEQVKLWEINNGRA